jgi:hypothetical protein
MDFMFLTDFTKTFLKGLIVLTPQITGGKKQSDEGAALFAVRVHLLCYVIVLHCEID